MNIKLKKQIDTHLGKLEHLPQNLYELFDEISVTYDNFDEINITYEKLLNNSPIGIYTVNSKGVIDYVNPKFLEISGTDNKNKLLGLDVLNLPTYKKSGLDNFVNKGLSGEPFETTILYTSYVGGKESYRHYRGVPIFKSNKNEVESLLLLVEDITQRKKVEEKNRQLAQFPNLNPAPVLMLNYDFNIISANSAALKYYDLDEMKGLNWIELNKNLNINDLSTLIKSPTSLQLESQVNDKIVLFQYRSVVDPKVILVFGFDITTRKFAIEEASKSTKELKKLNSLMVGREIKMVELKKKIKSLEEKLQNLSNGVI